MVKGKGKSHKRNKRMLGRGGVHSFKHGGEGSHDKSEQRIEGSQENLLRLSGGAAFRKKRQTQGRQRGRYLLGLFRDRQAANATEIKQRG